MTPLSAAAVRILAELRRAGATSPERALTHRALAAATGVPYRDVIDATGELLESGILVLASCGTPPGCWLLPAGADPAPARRYLEQLTRRCLAIFRRRRAVKRAIDGRTHRQHNLFEGA